MKAKTKFLKWFYKCPEQARREIVFKPYGLDPYALPVIALEVRNKTKLGDKLLEQMGWKND